MTDMADIADTIDLETGEEYPVKQGRLGVGANGEAAVGKRQESPVSPAILAVPLAPYQARLMALF